MTNSPNSGLQSSMMGADIPPAMLNQSLADLIGLPGDIPTNVQALYFPFMNKAMQLGNLSQNDILDILANFELARIEEINDMRRYELDQVIPRGDHVRAESHLISALSNSKDGFTIKQLTATHKHITMDDGRSNQSKGMIDKLFRRGGGGQDNG